MIYPIATAALSAVPSRRCLHPDFHHRACQPTTCRTISALSSSVSPERIGLSTATTWGIISTRRTRIHTAGKQSSKRFTAPRWTVVELPARGRVFSIASSAWDRETFPNRPRRLDPRFLPSRPNPTWTRTRELLTHTDDDIYNFPLFPGDHWHGIARHVLAKQASRSERAGVFSSSLFHFHLGSLGEALGTYCLDMIPGTRFQGRGAQKQRVFGGVFGVLSLRGPADILDRASVQHISFPWSRQHGINWRWRTDLAYFARRGTNKKGRRKWNGGDGG